MIQLLFGQESEIQRISDYDLMDKHHRHCTSLPHIPSWSSASIYT
jgi:hypothetical protein